MTKILRRLKARACSIITVALATVIFYTCSTNVFAGTYYVATNGNDGNSCDAAENISSPKRSIMGTSGGIGCLQTPGDTLFIREGTYQEIIDNHTNHSLPSGTNWADGGFTIAAYPNETVIIQKISLTGNLAYWTFDGLRAVNLVAGTGEAIWVGGQANHLRFVNMEATTAGRADQCILGRGAGFIEFINVEIHHCGDPTAGAQSGASLATYGVYWGGSDTLFDQIKLHDTTGYGFHIFSAGCDTAVRTCPDRVTISNSEIYNTGTLQGSAGILFAFGDDNQAYGNIIKYNVNGIAVGYGASNTKIYGNTISENLENGITSGSGWGNRPDSNTAIENNMITSNGGYGISNSASGTPQGEPIGTIIRGNIVTGNRYGTNGILDTGVNTEY